jgi:hypothetical protein
MAERSMSIAWAPVTAANDLNWQSSPSQGEIVVAARTAGRPRIVAASCELDFHGGRFSARQSRHHDERQRLSQ